MGWILAKNSIRKIRMKNLIISVLARALGVTVYINEVRRGAKPPRRIAETNLADFSQAKH